MFQMLQSPTLGSSELDTLLWFRQMTREWHSLTSPPGVLEHWEDPSRHTGF